MKKIFLLFQIIFISMLASCNSKQNNYFTISWLNYDNTVLLTEKYQYGDFPRYKGNTPKRNETPSCSYSFEGWDKNIMPVTKNESYIARYKETNHQYTIKWIDKNGRLYDTEAYNYGDLPTFKGVIPPSYSDQGYTYSFSGWSPKVEIVTKDQEYIAQYEKICNKYRIIWRNYDGTVLSVQYYYYGTTPHFPNGVPTRKSDNSVVKYNFKNWDTDIEIVKGDKEYTAVYTEVLLLNHSIEDNRITITANNDIKIDEIVIPKLINWIPIKSIEPAAFYKSNITSITIGENIETIGADAFEDCGKLTIFCEQKEKPYGWNKLWNRSNCPVIWGYDGYKRCTNDYEYVISSGKAMITAILTKIVDIDIPTIIDGLIVSHFMLGSFYKSEAFKSKTLRSFDLPDSIVAIGYLPLFSGFKQLTRFNLANAQTNVYSFAFKDCSSLKTVRIGGVITSIGEYAFHGCSSLASIVIPSSVTSIGNYAFYGCSSLTSINIPDGVTSIGNYAFYGCGLLSSIIIPNSVTWIGAHAFYNCRTLTIYCMAKSQPKNWNSSWNSSNCPVIWGYTP